MSGLSGISPPAEHGAHIAQALERAEAARRDISRVEAALGDGIEALRMEMQQGFHNLTDEIIQLRLENAKRSGAERLFKWLFTAAATLFGFLATLFAAGLNEIHPQTHH
jgi:hypothetical protein